MEMVGVYPIAEVSIGRRLRCFVPEILLVIIAIALSLLRRRIDSLKNASFGDRDDQIQQSAQSPKIVRFSLVAVGSGMTAVSHPSLIDIPFLIVFLVYCISWSVPNSEHYQHQLFSRFFPVSSASSSYSKLSVVHLYFSRMLLLFCAVIMLVHYITFIPYMAHQIPDHDSYKAAGLNWLENEHGVEGNIDLGVGNVLHVIFLSSLFLLLCAYDKGKSELLKKPKDRENRFPEESSDSDEEILANDRKSEVASVGTHSVGGFRYSRSHASFISRRLGAESKRKLALTRIITICRINAQRYCSRILVVLIAVVIVLQPSAISSLWLVVFLFSLLRRYTFFQYLTPTLFLAVIHVVGVWVVSIPGVVTSESQRKSLTMAGLDAGDCGGVGNGRHSCQLLLLPILGLLLVFVCMTSRLYKKRKLQHELGDLSLNDARTIFDPNSIVDRTRRQIHKAFIAISIFVMYLVSCWTVDGAHSLLFISSLVFFFYPRLAHKRICSGIRIWSFFLFYISAMLCFLYLFRLLEEDFIPALKSVRESTQDVVGLHDRNTWQLSPLFLLLFFAIKQRDILKVKCFQRKHSFKPGELSRQRESGRNDTAVEMTSMSNLRDVDREVDTATAAMVKQNTLVSEVKLKFKLFIKLSLWLGVPPSVILDITSLTVLLCVAGFGGVNVIYEGLFFFFLILSFVSIGYSGFSDFSDSKSIERWEKINIRAWQACRFYTTVMLTISYFYQWTWCRSKIQYLLEKVLYFHVSGLKVFGSGKDYHGGSIDVFFGLLPLQIVLIFSQLEVLFRCSTSTHNLLNRSMSIVQMTRQLNITENIRRTIIAYATCCTAIALFVGAVLSSNTYRSSLLSTPYALFLGVYMFAPAFGIKSVKVIHSLIQWYSFLCCISFIVFQLPVVQENITDALGDPLVEYIGLRVASGNLLGVLWTHTLVYIVALLNSNSLKWEQSQNGQQHSGYSLFSDAAVNCPTRELAFTLEYAKFTIKWMFIKLKTGFYDFGSHPEKFAKRYAYGLTLFSLLLLISLIPHTVLALICLVVMIACHRIGRAGMGLPLPFCSSVSRWFVVFLVTWTGLCLQYLLYLGLPPSFDETEFWMLGYGNDTSYEEHYVPYNFTELGDYRDYLNVDVTPVVLAAQAFVVMCVVAQWGVLKRDKLAGINPYLKYQESLLTTSAILYEKRKQFRDARRAIWAIYGSGVLAERVPYPLGDLHSIAVSSGLPVTGCGCSACTHAPSRLVLPEKDFTSSSHGTRTPFDHIRYFVCITLPYLTITMIFIDGARSADIGIIDCSKIFLSIAFFHLCDNLKWRGSHLWRWILRTYGLFLFTSCVLSFPEVTPRLADSTASELKRHLAVKDYAMHGAVMVLAYLMGLLFDRQDWAFILYRDQQLQIQSRDTGEKIQQEWLVRLDEKKRLLVQAKEKRRIKLISVKAGCSSTDVTICPRCARMPNDDLCEDCEVSLRRTNFSQSFASSSRYTAMSQPNHSIGPRPIESGQGLSLLEEKLIAEGYIGRSKFSTLAVTVEQPRDEVSTCSSSTILSVAWDESKESSKDTSPRQQQKNTLFGNRIGIRGSNDAVPTNQSISTITMGGRHQNGKTIKRTTHTDQPERVIVLRNDDTNSSAKRVSVHEDEFSSTVPYLHVLNRLVDVLTKYLQEHSIPYPIKQTGRYDGSLHALRWFAASHTDIACYLLFISNFLVNPCVMNLPPVVSMLVYALILYPRPHVLYWRVSLHYLYFLIIIKSAALSILKGPFDDLQIRFPFLFGQVTSFFSGVYIELLSILAIIGHRYMLRTLGLWSDISLYCHYELTKQDGKFPLATNSLFAPQEVTITQLCCEEVSSGKLIVSESSLVTYSIGVGSGMLLKQTDDHEPRIVTHLIYNCEENTLRDQDGCGGKIPENELGEALSLVC